MRPDTMRPDTIDLDHVAIAVERHAQAFPRYAGDLGGRWQSGGFSIGFAPAQLGFLAGIRLEILAPNEVERNDFLRRFLDRNGPGPHHLTFKVADIQAVLGAAEAAGYSPVNVDLSDPYWQEAFIHPKDGPGVLIQLAQVANGEWRTQPPEGFPIAPDAEPANFVHVAHAMRHLDDGLKLFAELLGGSATRSGKAAGERWVDLEWPGSGCIRLIAPDAPRSPLSEWIGDRPGRVHHLAFELAHPDAVPAARQLSVGIWEVAPEDNLGVRLVLIPDHAKQRSG
jgi:methylmalonyl-CoA/ethylmalonyl-CoA epimerase